eukprot:g3863.t1
MNGLLTFLEAEHAFTGTFSLFVLHFEESYGYMDGFSRKDLQKIASNQQVINIVSEKEAKNIPTPSSPRNSPKSSTSSSFVDLTSSSQKWAHSVLSKMANMQPENIIEAAFHELKSSNLTRRRSLQSSLLKYARTRGLKTVAGITDECIVDTWIASNSRLAWMDLSAGQLKWGPVDEVKVGLPKIQVEAIKVNDELNEELHALRREQQQRSEAIERHCTTRHTKYENHENCEKLRQEKSHLDNNIAALETVLVEEEKPQKHKHVEKAKSSSYFLKEFSSTVIDLINEIITPPLSPPHLLNLSPSTSLTTSIPIYVISSHHKFPSIGRGGFDVEVFQSELRRLQFPGQTIHFELHHISLEDQPALATAIAKSKRTTVISKQTRHYIDSHSLAQYLRRDSSTTNMDPKNRSFTPPNVTSIFFLSLDWKYPVFIDKIHLAQAVSKNLVIAVQSTYHDYISSMQCSHKFLSWNIRNPMAQILTASASAIWGIQPAPKSSIWSTGTSPLSHTSNHAQFSLIDIDTAHRNFLIEFLTKLNLFNEDINDCKSLQLYKEKFDIAQTEVFQLFLDSDEHGKKTNKIILENVIKESKRITEVAQMCHKEEKHIQKDDSKQRLKWKIIIMLLGIPFAGVILFLPVRQKKMKIKVN